MAKTSLCKQIEVLKKTCVYLHLTLEERVRLGLASGKVFITAWLCQCYAYDTCIVDCEKKDSYNNKSITA